jgi:hypothetical protein
MLPNEQGSVNFAAENGSQLANNESGVNGGTAAAAGNDFLRSLSYGYGYYGHHHYPYFHHQHYPYHPYYHAYSYPYHGYLHPYPHPYSYPYYGYHWH